MSNSASFKILKGEVLQQTKILKNVVFIKTPNFVFILKPTPETLQSYKTTSEVTDYKKGSLYETKITDTMLGLCFNTQEQNPEIKINVVNVFLDISQRNKAVNTHTLTTIALSWEFTPIFGKSACEPEILITKYEIYRPSNHTEGNDFTNRYCENCGYYKLKKCKFDIPSATMFFQTSDPEYPVEWLIHADGEPFCWEFLFNG